MLNNERSNTVRYSFYHDTIGNIYIDEPIGFNNDDLEYSRNSKYDGIFTKITNNLEFYDLAKTTVDDFYESLGINGRLELIKEELQGTTSQVWTKVYRGYSDFTTYVSSEFKTTCNFTSNDLEDLIRAREGIDIEIDRTDTLDGRTITEITKDDITLTGKDILAVSQSILNDTQLFEAFELPDGSYILEQHTPLTTKVSEQQVDFSEVTLDTVGANWSASNMFFVRSDAVRTVTVTLEIDALAVSNIPNGVLNFKIYKLNWNGTTHDVISNTTIGSISFSGIKETINYEGDFSLSVDDSLAMSIDLDGVDVTIRKFNLTVSEKTSFVETNPIHKFIFVDNILDKLVTIITNKDNSFKSNFFGRVVNGYSANGTGSLTGVISGFSIRNFLKGAERYKPLTISLKDIISSLDAVWNVGMGVEKVNGRNKVVIEDRKYFYKNYITIELGEVTDLEISVDEKGFYNELEFGYQKSGGYEQDMGLDEPSAKSKFSTSVLKVKNKYTKTSKIRNDAYGKEFARRKPQDQFPTEDTKYDGDNWFLDVKDNGGVYTEKLWADRFSEKPTGVFSIDTLTGAFFSPINNLLRHSWWFSQGFEKDLDKDLKFVSSTGNSDLKTKISTVEYLESGDILNYNLERPLVLPKIYKFKKEVSQTLLNTINAYSTIDGESVPNLNGLISFTFNGSSYFGYLRNLKPNGIGDWELIASNKVPKQSQNVLGILQAFAESFSGTSIIASIIDTSVNSAPIIGTLSYISKTSSSVSLSWTAATDDVSVANYKVYYRLSTDISWSLFSTLSGSTLSETVTGLSEYTDYDFKINAIDGDATPLTSSDSNIVSEKTSDGTAPTIGVLTVGTPTDTEMPLTWTAATDNVSVTGYKVLYKLSSGSTWTTIDTLSTLLSYTITGLSNSTSYDVKIQAYDAIPNISTDSNIETKTTLAGGSTWYSYLRTKANLTQSNACSDSLSITIYMLSSSPIIGDYVYNSSDTSDPLIGNNNWYKIDTFGSFKIDNSGKTIDTLGCPEI